MKTLTPLEDPNYQPKHPPINGTVPWVVGCWGPRSQLRWFTRFRRELKPRPRAWAEYHCESLEHKDTCCLQCEDPAGDSPSDRWYGEECCCRGYRREQL